jgi:lysophospholipase L1-like esterase
VTTIAPEPLRGPDAARAALRAVLERAARKDGLVRVQFWGASHVAGEYFTGTVRRLLQDRHGDAGHGFVMPAAPFKGYRASDVNLCSGGPWATDYHNRPGGRADGLLGPAGMMVESADPLSFGWVQTTRTNPHGRSASRLEVWYARQPGGGSLELVVDDAAPIVLSTAAPSTADGGPGAAVLSVADGPHRLRMRPVGDGQVRLYGAALEREGPGVVVDAMGVGGRTVSSWLAWDEALQRAYLQRRPPDLAVLAYGTNEANDPGMTEERYRATLRDSLARFRRVAPDAACVLIGPSDRGKKVRRGQYVIWGPTDAIARIQQEVAPEFGCLSWDLQQATGGPGSMFRWREAGLGAEDLIHFTARGYEELATRFVAALDAAVSAPPPANPAAAPGAPSPAAP